MIVEPMGTRLIDSTPPATTTSYWPAIRPAAAKCTDCCEEPHCRSTVTPVTVSGQPAVGAAVRAMSKVCSPTWLTQPQITSSTSAGSTPARCTRLFSTCADRSAGWTPERPPFRFPTGVRTASTITASRMCAPSVGRRRPSRYEDRSAVLPDRRALLGERRRTFAGVLAGEHRRGQLGLAAPPVLDGPVGGGARDRL